MTTCVSFSAPPAPPYCIHHDVPIIRLTKEKKKKMILSKLETRGWNNPDSSIQTPASRVMGVPVDRRSITIYAPVVVGRKGEYYQLLYDLLNKGYEKVVVDGKVH